MNDTFKNEQNHFFNDRKKPNEMGRSRTINERNEKSRTCPSLEPSCTFVKPELGPVVGISTLVNLHSNSILVLYPAW